MTTPSRCLARLALAVMLTAAGTAAAAPGPSEKQAAPSAGHPAPAVRPADRKKPAKPVKQIDINAASRAELKKLPGIGDAEADKIVAGRPFLSKVDLVTRKILPEGIYISIKHQIVARPKPGKLPVKK